MVKSFYIHFVIGCDQYGMCVAELVVRLSTKENIALLLNRPPGVKRYGISA